MKGCAITISLVSEARGGPFVFWDDLEGSCAAARELGFDAVEIFAPSANRLAEANLPDLLSRHELKLAALGTGGGWVLHKLHLSHPDGAIRRKAIDFIKSIIEAGAPFGAPAILGSMQGRLEAGVTREQALTWIGEGVCELEAFAKAQGTFLLLEPLNRYESPFFNRVSQATDFLAQLGASNTRILADLFHMNIEEANLAETFRQAGRAIGHVHFVDSNRRAVGSGHLDIAPIAAALNEGAYDGYLSAEAIPLPDSKVAARQTIESYRRFFAAR